MSSRLWQVLREDLGWAYHISSGVSGFDDVGTLDISAGVEPDKLGEALRRILREMRRLTETIPTRAEVRRACDYACGQLDLSLENTEHQMMWIGERFLGYGQVESAAAAKRQLHEIGRASCRERV